MKKLISAILMSTALVAGLAGATAAYRSAAEPPPGQTAPAAAAFAAPAPQVIRPGTRFRWAPCPAGSQLVKRACVTDVVRTVVIPAAPVYAPASTGVSNGGRGAASYQGDDDGSDHEADDDRGDDGGHDEGDDEGDDNGGENGGNNGGDD